MAWGKQKAEEHIQCSLVRAPTVYLEPVVRQKIGILMEEYPHQEWLAYLTGRMSEKGNIFVEDMIVPPHKEVSGASAEAEPQHQPSNCVGIIHSHHSMGAFHSGTDQAYVDKNYPVSITVARNGVNELTYDAVSYVRTPCGKDTILKSTVKYVQPEPLFDKDTWLKEAKENIERGKRIYKPVVQPQSFVPVRYRLAEFNGDYVTDNEGHILSRKELNEILDDIYGN